MSHSNGKMADSDPKGKPISVSAFQTWPNRVKDNFEFEQNDNGTKYVKAICKICRKHYQALSERCKGRISNDVQRYGKNGTDHLLLPNLIRHIDSRCHIKALELENVPGTVPRNQSTLGQSFVKGQEAAVDQCVQLLNMAWFVASNERPFTDFPKLGVLMTENGVTIPGGYTTNNSCQGFCHLLATEITENVKSAVKLSNFFSFLIDGSTVYKRKISHEGELLYLRTAGNLKPKVELFDFVSMKDYVTVTAEHLTHAVKRGILSALGDNPSSWKHCEHDGLCECIQPTVTPTDIPMEKLDQAMSKFETKLIGGSADGAAVNFGSRKGLMTRFQEQMPWFVAIHCLSHRLELAIGDALKNSNFKKIDDFLDATYLHFRNSPKEWMGLQATAQIHSCRAVQPPKAFGTRFVSYRARALSALMTNWVLLVFLFSDEASSSDKNNSDKAKGFLKDLTDAQFLARCWAYGDLLQVASKACCLLQASNLSNIAHAVTHVTKLKLELKALAESPGEKEEEILTLLKEAPVATRPVNFSSTRRSQPEGINDNQKEIKLPVKKTEKVRKRASDGEVLDVSDTFVCPEPITVKACSLAERLVPKEREEAAQQMVQALDSRFEEFENHADVLAHLGWLQAASWPICATSKPSDEELKRIKDFQAEDVAVFIDQYLVPLKAARQNFSKQRALKQFYSLKLTRALSATVQGVDDNGYWHYVFKTEPKNEDLFLVVEIALCLPFSEAVVERGFSAKGRILSDWRCSLSHTSITDLLHFSTRKGDTDPVKKKSLIRRTASKFVQGKDGKVGGLGLSTRRVNKLCASVKNVVHEHQGHDVDSEEPSGSEIISPGTSETVELSDSEAQLDTHSEEEFEFQELESPEMSDGDSEA